jgi:YidC/Oxa1 family membrane protein insertase
MKTDKNTLIGIVLLFALFVLYFWYNNQQNQKLLTQTAEKKRIEDSIAKTKIPPVDTAKARIDSLKNDTLQQVVKTGDFADAANGTQQDIVIENNVIKATFSNKGGILKQVELKNYISWDSSNVVLAGGRNDKLGYAINTGSRAAQTTDLYFTPSEVVNNADGSKAVSYTLSAADGKRIVHQFLVRKDDYLIDWSVVINGADKVLSQGSLNMEWNIEPKQHQKDISYERQQSRLCYSEGGSYNFEAATNGLKEDLSKPLDWLTVKQQFFNTTILAKQKFENASVQMTTQADSVHKLLAANSNMRVKMPASPVSSANFQLYYGPNDYKILKSYDNGMMNIVDLGSGIFSFVKYINRFIILPVFNFFASFISNFGWVIALLTLFIRLVTSPLTYGSYLSGAKMKVLRPELDTLKKKFGSDQQGYAVEQMKLFREAGVSPLGGCLPALLQIPIFFSLYSFFNSNIAVRGIAFYGLMIFHSMML